MDPALRVKIRATLQKSRAVIASVEKELALLPNSVVTPKQPSDH